MKIATGHIIHESNTFAPGTTPLGAFVIRRGDEIVREHTGAHTEVTGFLEGAVTHVFELAPMFSATATPSAIVTAGAFDWLADELVSALRAAGKIDGILLALHGAFVSENHPNADAEFARRVREAFGPDMPIVLTHDPHSSIGEDVVRQVNALVIYKTNPHLDQRQIGLQAAGIIAGMVRGAVKPVMAYRSLPMMINIVHQHTSAPPLRDLWRALQVYEQQAGVLAASMSLCYQYSDVPAMGNAVVVVTDNNQAQADAIADELAAKLWALREELAVHIPTVHDAVAQAMDAAQQKQTPQVIVDIGDNVGGGSAADGTFILTELLAQRADGWVVTLADPKAVQACTMAGIGATLSLDVGGATDEMHGAPVRVTGRVKCLHDGRYEERAARHGGVRWGNQGLCALLELAAPAPGGEASYILLTTARAAPLSLHQLQSVGIEPGYMKILTVKAAIAWKAAYEPIMAGFVVADTPGATQVNPKRWHYRNVRKNLFGLEGWP